MSTYTSKLAIDFGSARTKAAYLDKYGRPATVRLGHGGSEAIPSLLHVGFGEDAKVSVGEAAEYAAEADPIGLVLGLKKEIHRSTPVVFGDGRPSRERIALAAELFKHVREKARDALGDHPRSCILTVPARIEMEWEVKIRSAAKEAGFEDVSLVEEPVAAAIGWLKETEQNIEEKHVIVCDIGGGTTDFALVSLLDGDPEVCTEVVPDKLNRGGNDIDEGVWEAIMEKAAASDRGNLSKVAHFFRRKIGDMREKIAVVRSGRFNAGSHGSVDVDAETVEAVSEKFVDDVCGKLKQFHNTCQGFLDGEGAVVLIVGGGSRIKGMEVAIQHLNLGKVVRWDKADFATVLGAVPRDTADDQYVRLLKRVLREGQISEERYDELKVLRQDLELTKDRWEDLERKIWHQRLEEICVPEDGLNEEIEIIVTAEDIEKGWIDKSVLNHSTGQQVLKRLNMRQQGMDTGPHSHGPRPRAAGVKVTRKVLDVVPSTTVEGFGNPGRFGGKHGDLIVRFRMQEPLQPPGKPTEDAWHYYINGNLVGPLATASMHALIQSNKLCPEDFVTKNGGPFHRLEKSELFTRGNDQTTDISRTNSGAMFLYIPTARLIVMSIVSLGIYEAYWIYRNWRYIKERDGLKIQPFWRGIFGIFFIHSLLKAIKTDPATKHISPAKFSPGSLATGWIILHFLGNVLGRTPDPAVNLFGIIISTPTFLFLLPAQNHINALNEVSPLRPAYYPFSIGHIVCLVIGIIGWILILVGLAA